MPDFALEAAHGAGAGDPVIGVDEAGRGPWAGPVVAAAVWLDPERLPADLMDGLDDSKKIAAARREVLFAALLRLAEEPEGPVRLNFGAASVAEIDRLNVLKASLLAMTRAVMTLTLRPAMALVDGDRLPALACPARAVVGGDGRSLSIAAASVAAKVLRDRVMRRLAEEAPGYGWERNAGYGTPDHRAALARLGVTPHHRRSFRPVRALLAGEDLR